MFKNLALCDLDDHVKWRARLKINWDVKEPLAVIILSASEEVGQALIFQNDC